MGDALAALTFRRAARSPCFLAMTPTVGNCPPACMRVPCGLVEGDWERAEVLSAYCRPDPKGGIRRTGLPHFFRPEDKHRA